MAPAPALTWQSIWSDALSSSLGLASEMVLNPDIGSSALQTLMSDVLPAGFIEAASQAAAGDIADVSEQLQIQRQLHALSFWQTYTNLDVRYQQWREDWAGSLAGGAPALLAQLADQGKALVGEMLELALADSLRLPAPDDLAQHLAALAAQDDANVEAEVPVAGECMAMPRFDSADERPNELLMAVTVAGQGADPDAPFTQLQVGPRSVG